LNFNSQGTNPINYVDLSKNDERSLCIRATAAFTEAEKWQGLWQRILNFISPNFNNYWNAAGTTGKIENYSSYAFSCSNSYAAQLVAAGFPPRSRWCSFVPSTHMILRFMELNDFPANDENFYASAKDTLTRGLKKISDRAFDLILDSNFDEICPAWIRQFSITDSFMRITKDYYRGHGISFFVPPLGSYAYDIDAFGNIWGVFYQTESTVANAKLQWDLNRIPPGLKDDCKINVIECYVREDMRWRYELLITPGRGSDGSTASFGAKTQYFNFLPWSVLKGISTPAEIWSRGIITNCFSDIVKENIREQLDLINRELATNVMFMYRGDDASFNPHTFRSQPGAMVRVKEVTGPKQSLAPITIPYNQSVHQSSKVESRADISRNLLGDPILNKDSNTYLTAREWSDRQRMDQLRFGVNFGAINRAAKNLLLSVAEHMMAIEGIAIFPDELKVFEKGGIKELASLSVQLESPISKMYTSQEVESLTAMLQISAAVSPELTLSTVKVNDIPRWLAEKMGIDIALFKTAEEQAEEANAAQRLSEATNPAASVVQRRPGIV
jgi:hypothetical protein